MIRIRITGLSNVTSMWSGYPLAVQMYVRAVGGLVATQAKKYFPVSLRRTHPKSKRAAAAASTRLGKSIRVIRFVKAGVDSVAFVGSEVRHFKYFTLGTLPHVIERRRAKALTIFKPSAPDADEYGFIFRRQVNHPGNAGSLWRQYAWGDVSLANMQRAWGRAIRAAAKKVGHTPGFGEVPVEAEPLEQAG